MHRFIINILLLFIPYFGFAQVNDPGFVKTSIDTITNEFFYDYYFQKDSTNSDSKRYQEMILQVGKRCSKFTASNKLLMDSLMFAYKDLELGIAVMKVTSQMQKNRIGFLSNFYVYKNYPHKGEVNFIGDLGSKSSLQVKEMPSFNWKHVEGDTTILSFSCQKATCSYGGRDFIAWFTPEIPISDGPYKFSGLPGLIVRVADAHNEHVFELYKVKNVRKNREMSFIEDHDLSETTPQKFTKALKQYMNSLYLKWGGNPNIQFSNLDGEAKMLKNIRSTNNFIEKY